MKNGASKLMSWIKGLPAAIRQPVNRNIILYILGIMSFKFAVEPVNHYYDLLISYRYEDSRDAATSWAVALAVNNFFQCIGSLVATTLIFRFSINRVLSLTTAFYGVLVICIPLLTITGTIKNFLENPSENEKSEIYKEALYVPLFILNFCLIGLVHGMIELIRRVIPQSIVGVDESRLKRMDAYVHIFYEVAGVSSAYLYRELFKDSAGIPYVMMFFIVCSTLSAFLWGILKLSSPGIKAGSENNGENVDTAPADAPKAIATDAAAAGSAGMVTDENVQPPGNPETNTQTQSNKGIESNESSTYELDCADLPVIPPVKTKGGTLSGIFRDIISVFTAFGHSVANGCVLVCCNRSLIWLIPAYSFPLVIHKYFENIMLKQYAVAVYDDADLRLFFQSGSNLGELLGAALILFFSSLTASPIPWIRIDAISLLLVWFLKFPTTTYQKKSPNVSLQQHAVFFLSSLISLGFASGDVSLAAFIQSRLANAKIRNTRTSPLGSVMAFLYVCYIVMFAAISIPIPLLVSKKKDIASSPGEKDRTPYRDFVTYGSIAFSIASLVVLLATFIPRKSFAWNPNLSSDTSPLYYIGCKRDVPRLNSHITLKPAVVVVEQPMPDTVTDTDGSNKEASSATTN